MSCIFSYSFRSPELALAETLAGEDIELEVEYIGAQGPEELRLFVWVSEGVSAFDDGIERDPTVTDPVVVSDDETERLYSLATTDAVETTVYPLWATRDGEGLSAHYEDGWWHSEIRFPTREQLAAYREALLESGVQVEVRGIYREESHEPAPGLTTEQREALTAAYRNGYFSVPRETTTAALAETLDISGQAVSERLRRGYARLVDATFGDE
ncbi:helix-turn-helix domain-containing protein [Halosegnis longus]|uniref:helix-turn-helix domain-containing protein n=1 Tax=Halosegnis longus TaxID=2216012 RepID=UPI00096A53C4|nr:helix-turn-helix domain-containing protein [Salella cibi]